MNMNFHMPKEVETYNAKRVYMAGFTNTLIAAQLMGYLNVDIRNLKIEDIFSKQDIEKLNSKSIAV